LGELCKYLAKEAESIGVEIFCGFPAIDFLYSKDKTRIAGVLTNTKGVSKSGEKKSTFEESVEIQADVTILAEGSRGILKN
jgi:electron-transferring-flavoprotein dehydrogenase